MLRLALLGALAAGASHAACTEDAVDLRGPWGQARFTVEIADTPAARAQGLMFRDVLPRSAGMLFVYEHPQPAAFWMKNTLIPLDMLFLGAGGRVEHIASDARPKDLTPIPGGDDVFAVLEINGGLARRLGITEGSEMRHPAFPQAGAAWPCAAP